MNAGSETDLDAITHLDDFAPLTCTWRSAQLPTGKCEQPARWLAVCQTDCGAASECCNTHRLIMLGQPRGYRCRTCGLAGHATEILRFVPLSGSL